jgi:hypothetical protein
MSLFHLLDHDLALTEMVTQPLVPSHQRISSLEQCLKYQLSSDQWQTYVDLSDATLDHHLAVNEQYFEAGVRWGMALMVLWALSKAKC